MTTLRMLSCLRASLAADPSPPPMINTLLGLLIIISTIEREKKMFMEQKNEKQITITKGINGINRISVYH